MGRQECRDFSGREANALEKEFKFIDRVVTEEAVEGFGYIGDGEFELREEV